MTDLTGQVVLDLAILADMYGDDSAQTICQVLTGFRNEAITYIGQLQHAFVAQQYAEIARLSHSLKSMTGLIGAHQLMTLCQVAEQAARQCDPPTLARCGLELDQIWPVLLVQLDSSLQQHGHMNA